MSAIPQSLGNRPRASTDFARTPRGFPGAAFDLGGSGHFADSIGFPGSTQASALIVPLPALLPEGGL